MSVLRCLRFLGTLRCYVYGVILVTTMQFPLVRWPLNTMHSLLVRRIWTSTHLSSNQKFHSEPLLFIHCTVCLPSWTYEQHPPSDVTHPLFHLPGPMNGTTEISSVCPPVLSESVLWGVRGKLFI